MLDAMRDTPSRHQRRLVSGFPPQTMINRHRGYAPREGGRGEAKQSHAVRPAGNGYAKADRRIIADQRGSRIDQPRLKRGTVACQLHFAWARPLSIIVRRPDDRLVP